MLNRSIKFLIDHKVVALLLLILVVGWGYLHLPFDLGNGLFPKDPVAVDAIPDIGENQQIVYTEWEGKSPQDIEDQITYPLSSNLLGVPGVKTVRSTSMFGFSSIYVIFDDDIDFYWSRSRLLEKLNALPNNLLPEEVRPRLGPDATALGQLFWYTLEGRDADGKVTGGWDLHEIRSVQDFYVKNTLASANGVSEVASIGGYVQEYQIDIAPELMRQYGIALSEVVAAVKESNKDVGAKTLEINKAEYYVRGLGYIKSIEDIENTEVAVQNFTPVRIKDIANVSLGPAERRGILDKNGAEVAGGVVVSRFGANPMRTIAAIKEKIAELAPGLPSKKLKDGRISKLTVVPFYDRSKLINETLDTLGNALLFEALIVVLVILVLLYNLRIAVLVSSLMPIAVLMVFIAMKLFQVDANIVALSGIAIAIGTMVDMGIILGENIVRHLQLNKGGRAINTVVFEATKEVSGAIITAGLTTIVSFVPVFTLTGAEGKLFTPLAFTKTAALTAAMIVTFFVIPPFAARLFKKKRKAVKKERTIDVLCILIGIAIMVIGYASGLFLIGLGAIGFLATFKRTEATQKNKIQRYWSVFAMLCLLGYYWRPLGFGANVFWNVLFVAVICLLVLGGIRFFGRYYERILLWAMGNRWSFLSIPLVLIVLGLSIMLGSGKEFMPALDEGAYLLMPSAMPHAGIEENKRVLAQLDMAVANMPEIETVVGKAGRTASALDPAPLSMFENVIRYKPEYILDGKGKPIPFATDENGRFKTIRGDVVSSGSGAEAKELVPDRGGEFYRNWREHIRNKEDIWNAIQTATALPGITSAPKLQPIETRLVMLQTGMRAPMGIKIKGQDLEQIAAFGLQLESLLKDVPGVNSEAVFADRIIGKPYLLLDIDRNLIARYGISIAKVQEVLEVAVGGKVLTETVEGRERYGVRVRYPREYRNSPEALKDVYVRAHDGTDVPMSDLVQVRYERGPQTIKSEDGFLVGYVLFDGSGDEAPVTVVENAKAQTTLALKNGSLKLPSGIQYSFTGTYENQQRAAKTLLFVIPLVLLVILLILYVQFRSLAISFMVFTGVAVAFSGGFLLIWLYGQDWFMNFGAGSLNFKELFGVRTVHLSVAVWVGFIALFGIATDDGVVMATYLKQRFGVNRPKTVQGIRDAVLEAGKRRIRPCLMTTATTILALLPILTATGRGSDVMVPMAIPVFGGMLVALITLFVVPVLFAWLQESKLRTEKLD